MRVNKLSHPPPEDAPGLLNRKEKLMDTRMYYQIQGSKKAMYSHCLKHKLI